MRLTMPTTYPSAECVLVSINTGIAPVVALALTELLQPHRWEAASFEDGYHAIMEVVNQMSDNCFTNLVQEIRDARGVMPAFASTPIPERTSAMYNSFNDLLQSALELRGIKSSGWFSNTYATLDDLIVTQQGAQQSQGTSMFETVKNLLDANSDVATVIGTISGFLTTEEATVVNGGLLLAILAVLSANSQLLANIGLPLASLNTNLTAILSALRGATAPTDNILEALRGTTASDANRNVVELLS